MPTIMTVHLVSSPDLI